MKLTNSLKTQNAQAITEYIVTFIVLAMGIIAVFGAFSPENISMRGVFSKAIDGAIQEINR